MSLFSGKKSIRKEAKELLRYTHFARNMREDVTTNDQLAQLDKDEAALKSAMSDKQTEKESLANAVSTLKKSAGKVMPRDKKSHHRENIEVIVIAIAIALAFRAYFFQPFKIPTGSMQPTLNGILFKSAENGPTFFDKIPLKIVKWVLTGDWYIGITAEEGSMVRETPGYDTRHRKMIVVGDQKYKVHKATQLLVPNESFVEKGTQIVSGYRQEGDHLFVNKIKWNFTKPKRGQIMVFKVTELNIENSSKNDFYIKRMCGMPGDKLSIQHPNLIIDGSAHNSHPSIMRIQNQESGYAGYTYESLNQKFWDGNTITLDDGEYLALGDNTTNSLDGRYWGPVPQDHLVGPASFVYWPFSRHFGLVK